MPTPPMNFNPTFKDMATGEHLTAINASTACKEEPLKPKVMRLKLTTNLNAAILPPQEFKTNKVAANKLTGNFIISTSRALRNLKLIHTSPKPKLGLSSPPETSPEPEIHQRKMEVPRKHIAALLEGVLHEEAKEAIKFPAVKSKTKQPVKRGASDNIASGKKKVARTSKKQSTNDQVEVSEVGNVAAVSPSWKQQPAKTLSILQKRSTKDLTTEEFSMIKRVSPWSRTAIAFKRDASPRATEYEERHQQLIEFVETQRVDGDTQNYTNSGWACLNKPEFKSSGWVCLNEPAVTQIVDLNDEANDQEQEVEDIQESYGINGITHINGLSLADVVKKARVHFEPFQDKAIARWMLEYGVRGTRSNPKAKAGYEILLQNLGFLNPILSEDVMKALNTKVRLRLSSIWKAMLRDGAVLPEDQGKEFEDYSIKFADWTETWLEPSWNGAFVRPVYWVSREFKDAVSECSEINEREFMATDLVVEPKNITEGGFMVTKAVFEAHEIIRDIEIISYDRFIVSEDDRTAAENQSTCILAAPDSTSEEVGDKPGSLFPMADHNSQVIFAQYLGLEPPALLEINEYNEADFEEYYDEDYEDEDDECYEDAEYEEAEEVPEDTIGACYARVLDIKPSIIDHMVIEKKLEIRFKEEQQVRLSCQPGCYAFALRGEDR